MTRATRRGIKKTPLPATSWKTLSHEGYTKVEDEETTSRIQKNNDVPLKVTGKAKLVDKTSKQKQLNKFLTGKNLKSDSETVALLPSEKTTSKKKTAGPSSEDYQDGKTEKNGSNGKYSSSTSTYSSYMDEKRKKQIEARRLRRQKRKVCFNCRNYGHMVQNCPQPQADSSSTSGICFKCGSSDHTSKTCRTKIADGEFPYAKCFICGEIGHLSRSCPDNPKGLYPHGGGCKICGSVEHLKSNCPEKANKSFQSSGFSTRDLVITNPTASVDAEEETVATNTAISGRKRTNSSRKNPSKQKIVKF